MESKTCTNCNQEKSLSEFSNSKNTKDGKMYVCKECNREINRIWRQTPSGIYTTITARQKFYGKSYDNRCKPVSINREDFMDWYNKEPKRCHYCEIPEEFIPKMTGGHLERVFRLTVDCIENTLGYSEGNLVLACNRCNLIKSNVFTHDEMIEIGQTYIKPKWELEMMNQTIIGDNENE